MAPPSLVSTMSMSITPQAPSENFVTAASRPRADQDGPWRPPSIPIVDVNRISVGAALPEVLHQGQTGEFQGPAEVAKKIWTYEEISRHRREDDAWIVVDGKVYDVSQFLESHPGGPELILDHLQWETGRDAGHSMRGKIDEDGHSHSKAAFRMLEQFMIGSVEASPGSGPVETNQVKKYRYDVDLTKPIVAQVGYLGPDYDEWVHEPVVCKESPRFFENDVQEFFTRTSWWVIPMLWCPIGFTLIYLGRKEGVPLSRLPAVCVTGAAIWTFLEYLLHRFLFHMKTTSFWGNTFHYILHGFHHKHPMDGARLVFPPAFSSLICIIIWVVLGSWFASYAYKLVLFGSAILAYVVYDLTHYFLHFGIAFNDHSRKMKRYHLNHHFKDQTSSYGITSTFWDRTFGTLPAAKISTE